MTVSNGNFIDEEGNVINIVQLLRNGEATPLVGDDGHYMRAHSGWYTDENGAPVNLITLVQTALAGKASTAVATQSENGLMSAQDKTKLDAVGSVVTVSGTTPTITALSGVRYICGEVSTLDITPCASGICDIVFTSGSTATVLTLPSTVKFPDGAFTPEANTTYELNIMDGVYGAVMAWT